MHDILLYAFAGGSVGFVIGMTGVGGGSLMTPILLAFCFKPAIAVGTDLLYAAITKAGGVFTHSRQRTVEWSIVARMALGSLPASLVTMYVIKHLQSNDIDYNGILTMTLGSMLVITSLVLLFRTSLLRERHQLADDHSRLGLFERKHSQPLTILMGVVLGVLVTLSSVGAGAFAAAVLMILYPRMAMIRIIGTDLAHAVPLTAVAGLGHLQLGHVDFYLLISLLLGSMPGIWLGTKIAYRVPEKTMQRILALILLALGLKYTLFSSFIVEMDWIGSCISAQ
ncbi:MAG: sulfite exporter TauE/SafE family protein [Gammaproteobacteria bacterium]|nr:sulfite exporter TauE/SafE family protein [Gammaproteobacteria bacterium]